MSQHCKILDTCWQVVIVSVWQTYMSQSYHRSRCRSLGITL